MAKTRTEVNSNITNLASIALWGPSGAGKDWLIKGFAREADDFSTSDPSYHYQLLETRSGASNLQPVSLDPPSNHATEHSADLQFEFRRISKINSEKYFQVHQIVIHNDNGEEMMNALHDEHAGTRILQTLASSKNVILVLGIPEGSDSSSSSHSNPIGKRNNDDSPIGNYTESDPFADLREPSMNHRELNSQNWGIQDYFMFIRRFFSIIEGMNKNIALCMTKADMQEYRGNPWQILERRYGTPFRKFIDIQQTQHNINVFYTSAAGYLTIGGNMKANFINGVLEDPVRWHPVNTALPFFWVFENIERSRWEKIPRLFRGAKPPQYPNSLSY